jgi:transcriptional regulator with XRE-family HTH domain
LAGLPEGVTQASLAATLGLHQSTVSRKLSGEIRWTLNELDLIARALDTTLSDLLGDGAGSSPRQREGSTPFNRQDGRKQKGTGRTLGPRTAKSSGPKAAS